MSAVILTADEVRRLLPMDRCMELVEGSLVTLAKGNGMNPLRWAMRLPEPMGILGMMPGWLGEPPALGLKVISMFPGNHGTRLDAHQGLVILFDTENGTPAGIFEASSITAIRTAAASGVATRALAREDAGDVALIGSGVQAKSHLEAMACARGLRRVRVYSRKRDRCEALATWAGDRFGPRVEAMESARACVEGADLVCTATSSREPVVEGNWLSPGAHVNAVGACVPTARELDDEAVRRARVFTDRRESALAEAGDLLIPMQAGVFGEDHLLGEVGDVLSGTQPGRTDPEEITLYESLGIAVEDLATAHHLLAAARADGVGTSIDLDGLA